MNNTHLFINTGAHPMSFGSHVFSGKKPTSSIHTLWSISMNFSNLWKGLAVVAVLFLLSMEASAQLPVRTQSLQLINATGGATLTSRVDPSAAGASYNVLWPNSDDHTGALANTAGDEAILVGTWSAAPNTWTLRWEQNDGFVDGTGADNHVTYWNPDNQTLDYSTGFEWNGSRLGIGVNNEAADPEAYGAPAAGSLVIGNGGAAPVNEIQLNVVPGEGTFGSATTAGSVLLTSGTGVNGVDLDGANGSATLGNATNIGGSIVMFDGDAVAGQSITIETANQANSHTVVFDVPVVAVPSSTFNLPMVTNNATTITQVLVSNGNGTASWADNAAASLKAGVVTPGAGAYSAAVVFTTPYAATPAVTVTPASPLVANGYVIQVQNVTVNGFTMQSSAPFDGTDTFSWIAVGQFNP